MIYDAKYDLDKNRAETRLSSLIKNEKRFEIREIRGVRTLKQNNYLHAILAVFAMELGYTMCEAKENFKRLSLDIFAYEKNGERYLRSSSKVDTKELTVAIDRFKKVCSEHGIYIPSPEDQALLSEFIRRGEECREIIKHYET